MTTLSSAVPYDLITEALFVDLIFIPYSFHSDVGLFHPWRPKNRSPGLSMVITIALRPAMTKMINILSIYCRKIVIAMKQKSRDIHGMLPTLGKP